MRLILDNEAIRQALQAVRDATPLLPQHPLFGFLLMRQQLMDYEQLGGDDAKLNAVGALLKECFYAVLGPQVAEEGLDYLKILSHAGNDYVRDMAILYFRYLRPDLDVTPTRISKVVGFEQRTLRRHQEQSERHLIQLLIERELTLRRQQHEDTLRTRIPFRDGRVLYGREGIVERVCESLQQDVPVLLVGFPGIGKTSLASAVAHRLVTQFDDLHWLQLTAHSDCLPLTMEAISTPSVYQRDDVLQYVVTHHVLLVLEGIVQRHVPQLEASLFRKAALLCTSEHLLDNWPGAVVEIPALEGVAAQAFFNAHRGDVSAGDKVFEQTYAASGGVPQSMIEYLNLCHYLGDAVPQGRLGLHQYFGQVWETLDVNLQRLWALMAFAGRSGLSLGVLADIFGVEREDVEALRVQNVFMLAGDDAAFALTSASQAFVQTVPVPNVDSIADIIEESQTKSTVQAWLAMLAGGLAAHLSQAALEHLLEVLAWAVAVFGLWERWDNVLSRVNRAVRLTGYRQMWIALEAARVARWRGQLANSSRDLKTLAEAAGRQGHFDIYARALMELGRVWLYQQNWEQAADSAGDAARYFGRHGYEAFWQEARLTQAAAMLHMNADAALTIVEALTDTHLQAAIIACEAALQQEDYELAVHYAEHAVPLAEPFTSNHGRVLCMLAIALRGAGLRDAGLDYQQQAINILTATEDRLGLARAYNNLGVFYCDSGERQKAADNWEEAFNLFRTLQDGAGLKVVRENLQLDCEGGAAVIQLLE